MWAHVTAPDDSASIARTARPSALERAGSVAAALRHAFHRALRWWHSEPVRSARRQAVADFFESWARVVRKTRMPTRQGVLGFLGNQVMINTVAWTAGLLAAGFVANFFEVRGFENLWGLTASRDRTLVSADDYRAIMRLTSYGAGLVMLITVRHLILRVVTEFHALRSERAEAAATDDGR